MTRSTTTENNEQVVVDKTGKFWRSEALPDDWIFLPETGCVQTEVGLISVPLFYDINTSGDTWAFSFFCMDTFFSLPMKSWEGNVFTDVCRPQGISFPLSFLGVVGFSGTRSFGGVGWVCPGVVGMSGVSMSRSSGYVWGGYVLEWVCPGGSYSPPGHQLQWDTVGKRAVCILLEYCLVKESNYKL